MESKQLEKCFMKLEKKLANYKHFKKIGTFAKKFTLGNKKLRLSYELLKVDLKEY